MARPHFVECRIIIRVGEIDLRVYQVLDPRTCERKRLYDTFGYDEFCLKLDRLPGPLRALSHQRSRRHAVATRLIAHRERSDARNENEIARDQRGRISGGRASFELLMLEVLYLESLLRNNADGLDVHVCAG